MNTQEANPGAPKKHGQWTAEDVTKMVLELSAAKHDGRLDAKVPYS